MIVAFDTYYSDNSAKTVGVGFHNWGDNKIAIKESEIIKVISNYEPGQFYKRELPCILSLLAKFDIETINTIIVDGYTTIDNQGKNGLGGYLYDSLEKKIPVIGVAKNKFKLNSKKAKEILRGHSSKPLFISSVGIDLNIAAEKVKSRHGDYRIPTMLKIVDIKTKEKVDNNSKGRLPRTKKRISKLFKTS